MTPDRHQGRGEPRGRAIDKHDAGSLFREHSINPAVQPSQCEERASRGRFTLDQASAALAAVSAGQVSGVAVVIP